MNFSPLAIAALDAHFEDLRRDAARSARPADPGTPRGRAPDTVAIRAVGPGDAAALARLAALDGGEPPAGRALIAEVGDRAVAVLPLEGGPALADPFEPTADVVRLLELRARQLRVTGRGHGPTRALHALAALLPAHNARRAA